MPATHSLVLLELSGPGHLPLSQGLPTMGFVDDISREGVSAAIYTQEQAGSSSKRRAWCYRGSVMAWVERCEEGGYLCSSYWTSPERTRR